MCQCSVKCGNQTCGSRLSGDLPLRSLSCFGVHGSPRPHTRHLLSCSSSSSSSTTSIVSFAADARPLRGFFSSTVSSSDESMVIFLFCRPLDLEGEALAEAVLLRGVTGISSNAELSVAIAVSSWEEAGGCRERSAVLSSCGKERRRRGSPKTVWRMEIGDAGVKAF